MSRTLARGRAVRIGLIALGAITATLLYLGAATRALALPTGVPGLPDGRGYEKVSPTNNADGDVYSAWPLLLANEGGWTELPYEAAPDGNALAYIGAPSEVGGTGREGGGEGNQYVAHRGSDGKWEASNVTPSADEFFTVATYQGFSSDFTHGFLTSNTAVPLVPGAPLGQFRIPYLRDFQTGSYETLMTAPPPHRSKTSFGAFETRTGSGKRQPVFAGASTDFSRVFFMANDALTPDAIDEGVEANNLYEYHDGGLALVNVLPEGSPEPYAVFGGPTVPRGDSEYDSPDFSHAISEDGSRVFWTGKGANQNLYVREDGSRTVQVDAGVGGGGQFWEATPDGSKVLFTKGGDIYEYDLASAHTQDLTPGAEVQGLVGASEDLSYVYFVANAALASGATPGNCEEDVYYTGECNLYALHAGELRFIARLSAKDDDTAVTSYNSNDGDWRNGLADRESEVTPDGRSVLFSSVNSLTGYENEGTEQLFVYDYEQDRTTCASCNPTGAAPSVDVGIGSASSYLPVSHQDSYSLHWMATDGSRVFFDSVDPLVPQDANGLTDVYEWERDGAGSCAEANGCLYLITGGISGSGAYLIDASASGNDVFFTTREQLVEEDQNENLDVYDAHVGAPVPPALPQCTGTGCQGLPSAPPVFATPSSVTYNGVGNFETVPKVAPKTKKPAVKKKGKKHKKSGKAKKREKAKKKHRSAKRSGKAKSGRSK